MRIYVASSWRNRHQATVVTTLRKVGHYVYDFRHPTPKTRGFAWDEIDPNWRNWNVAQMRNALNHPTAEVGYQQDFAALCNSDVVILVLPCGRSAHLEAGWAAGQRKRLIVFSPENHEPELMYRMASLIADDLDEVIAFLRCR